jgi:hypothetical protein
MSERRAHHSPRLHALITFILFGWSINRKFAHSSFVYCQNCRLVPTSVAIIWRGPDSRQSVVKHILVALLNKLMCTCNELQGVSVVELKAWVRNGWQRVHDGGGTSCVIFPPKSQPAPRGLTAQFSISSGSDHIRSRA